jgi:hypothetical protein
MNEYDNTYTVSKINEIIQAPSVGSSDFGAAVAAADISSEKNALDRGPDPSGRS